MKPNKTLLSLPVLPRSRDDACGTAIIEETYIAERDKVSTEAELWAHICRWRNVWLLNCPIRPRKLLPEEIRLLWLDFNSAEVLKWLDQKKREGLPLEEEAVKVMMHIAIPYPLLDASLFARRYGVGSDLGMVRMYLDPFKEFENHLRG